MASFLHQLKVLLWKNWLSVYRQPVWSVVLIFWPVVIFIILAITRTKYPPTLASDCYLAPRNLQSTGMIPFLQNFLCDTDTRCLNRSYISSTTTASTSTSRRLRKRSVDSGGGGSLFQMKSSSTLWDRTAGETVFSDLSVIKASLEELASGNVKGSLCAITPLLPTTQQATFQKFCSSDQPLTTFAAQAIFSLFAQSNSTDIITTIGNISTQIYYVQNNTALWNTLLMLPEWIKNPSLILEADFLLQFSPEIADLQSCVKNIVNQALNQSWTNTSLGILKSELQSCKSFLQNIPYASSQYKLGMEQTLQTMSWLMSSLTNGTSNNICEFNGLNITCNGTYNLDAFLQSVMTIVNETSSNSSSVIRYLQRTWSLLKQNRVDEMILQLLEQTNSTTSSSDPQMQRVFTQLFNLLFNATDLLIAESNMGQYAGVLQPLLDQMNALIGTELLNMESLNSTSTVTNLTQSIVKDLQYLSGFLSTSNMSSQSLVEVQTLIGSLSSINSDISSLNSTTLSQSVTIINQLFNGLQTLQTLLNANPVASSLAKIILQDMMATSSLNSSELVNLCVKEILTFLNTDVALINNLAFLNSYLNNTQLEFLQSEAFTSYAGDILNFLTPSNLQDISSKPNNVTLALLKLISGFIPSQEKETFHKVESIFTNLLDFISSCQTELSSCTSSIVVFQQQLSDMMQYINDLKSGNIQAIIGKDIMFVNFSKAEIAIVNTVLQMITCSQTQGNVTCKTTQDFYNTILGQVSSVINITLGTDSNLASIHPMLDQIKDNVDNIIQVLGSVDLTNLTSQLDNIAILSKCYRNATNNPVQCTMELSLSLMDYLQILPFPQPVHDTLLVASSIVKNWLGAVDGKTEMYQQLAYLHNVSSMAFYNQSTLMEIHRDFLYIVQWLDELSMTSVATETLIKDLLETLPLANITYTFPSSLLLQTSQGLQMVKTQLQTIEWYIEFVKNETNAFQTTGNIDVLVTMAQEIIRNVLSSVRSNPSLVPIADEILNVMNWLQKSHIIPVLQSVLNETLQNGGQSLEAFISHTVSAIEMIIQQEVVNGTLWTSSLNEITEGDVTFVVQLLQKYDNEQLANLSSVLLLTEKVIVTVESLVMDLQAVYNISQEVISILYNAEHNSSITKNIFYDIYSLLLEGWNGEIFKEFPMLKKRMRDLLYISMECLSENVDSSPPQNCSFEDIINVTKLMILELTNQTNIDFSTTEGNVTMNSFLEFVLNAIQQENVVNITNSKISITEELACLTKSLNISLQLVSRVNNHLGLNTSWIPEMDKALVKMTEKFSAFNFTCPTIDSKMANIMYQLAQNHTNFLQSLFPLVSDLTSIPSQYVKYTDQMFNIIKLYDAAQGQVNLNKTLVNLWNETLLQLFETNPNSSEWILASEILNILSNLSTYTGSDELKELSVILNRVADLTAAGLHLNTSLSNFSIFKIFESNFSTLIYNLMKLETSALNMTSTEKCEHTLITLLTFYQSNMNITLSQPVYANFSAWTCNMVFSNISDSDWLDVIMSLDSGAQKNATIKIISSFIQFITFPNMDSFEKFVTSVTERFFGKEPQSNFIVLQSLQDLIISLQSLVAQVMSSDNTNSGSTLENISIHVVEAVQVFLQSLNITGHNEIFAFASDMVHVYFDFRNSAMSLENLAQKILGQILTSFQESGLQNVFVQSVESQILSLPSAEQQVVHSFLLNVVSAINKTISEIARQPPSYNNNLVFNIIENIVKNFNRTYAMENLGGNKVITELIFSLVTDILQLAQNWNNISLAIAFPQNGSNSAVNELEGLLNTLLSLDAVDKDLYYNYSTALLKVFTAFFAKGEKDQVMQTIQYLLNFSNGTINVPVLVNALENFYDLLNLNKTLDLNILDLYIKQLSSFIANSQMIQDFSELSYLFNTSQKLFSGQSNEIRSAALELLPFFSPTSLYNISKDSDSFVSTLLNVMSKDLPLDQQLTIRNFTDTVLSLIKLIEKCSNDSIACDSAISDFQVLAINLVEVFTTIGNGTLNLKISNETLVELEKLSSLQISLINNIFSLLWSLQNTTDDMSGDLQNIFQDILSASQLILNITKELNAAQSDLEILKNYTQLMVTIEKVASANNVTATLLQILNLWKDFQCTNQNLLCMVNLTSHFLEFLQTLKVPKPLMGQVLAASSITKYWMSEINATADVYQQIVSLYELTRTTLQSEPTLQTILQTIMDISKIIQDMKIDNTSFSTVEDLILNIFKTLQDGDLLNSTASLPHINSTQFEKVQTEVKIIEWYIMYIKNMTENQNISGDPYVLYRLIQISLMDVMAGVHNWVEVWNRSNFSSHEIENLLQLLTRNETEAMGQLWLHLSDILQHMNSSQGLNTAEFTTILQIINGLLAGEMNVTQIDDIVKVLQTAIMTHNITEGAELFQLYNLILEVLNQTYSNGNMNLTQYFQSLLESFLAMDCQDVSRTFTHIYKFILNTTNLKNPWVDEMFISNFTLEVCRLLHWNNSQNDWFTLLQISQGLISYAIPLVPDSMSKYLTASEYILQVASEILAEPDVTQKNIMNILNVVPVISELFNISVMDWGQNGIFQKLAYFLLDLAWTSSSPKDVLLLKLQNFALTMAQDIQDILKAQPPSLHKAWMSFALEVVENFMNGTQDGSSEDRLLKQVWNSFRQSGLENAILSEFSDLVLHNSYASSENAQLLKDLLQLVFNITDSVISEAPLTTNTTINVLQMALSSILQTVLTQYKNVTMELSGLQTGMDMAMIFHDLQLLLDSMQIPTNASNIEASLFSLISKYVQIFLSNDTQHMKLLLDAEKIFNEFAQMNTTISIQELSAILANYLPLAGSNNETQASLYTILNMWQYLNNLTGAQSNDLSNITVQMLPIIQSILHKSSNVSELMSWLVNIISDHIPISEQEGFHQVANATQLLIDAVQTCSVTTMTCPGLAEEIQNFVLDVSQLEAFTQNRSLANGSLLHFGRYNESQISLINKIFLLLSCAMGYPSNASLSQGGVYEDVLSLQDWIFNTTMEESLNFTTNFSPQTIKEILNSVNITKFILQVENVLQASKCANYSDKDELLCKLNATLQLTWLLNQLPIGHTIHGNLSVISSILGRWISNFNTEISIYQQLIDLHNVTVLTLQYQPILQALNTSLVNIVHVLHDFGILQNISMIETDIVTNILSGIIQQLEFGPNISNHSSVLHYNVSDLLESMQLEFGIVNWLLLHLENQTGLFANSSGATMIKWMMTNYQQIAIIVRDVESVVNSFDQLSPNATIDAVKMLLEDLLMTYLPQTEDGQLIKTLETVINVTRILLEVTGPDMINQIHKFINNFITLQSDISNDPTKLLDLLSAMNQTGLISEIGQFIKSFSVSNDMQFLQQFLDVLNIFNNFAQKNKSINVQELSAILVKYLQLSSETASDVQHSLNVIFNLWGYLNNVTNGQSSNLSNMTIQLLPLLESHLLLNENTNISEIMSWVVYTISRHVPPEELDMFEKAANASLVVIEALETCVGNSVTCVDLNKAVQNFMANVVQLETLVHNRTLANCTLLQLTSYNQSQIVLINDLFLMLSYAMGQSSNTSTSHNGVYEDIFTLLNMVLNTTMEKELNITIPLHLQGLSEVLMSANISQVLLQVQTLLSTSICTNRTDMEPFLCKLNMILQVTQFLSQLPLPQPTHDNILVISTMVKDWLSHLDNMSTYQQLLELYNVTVLAFDQQFTLEAINTSLVNIMYTLHDMGILQNISLNDKGIVMTIVSEMIQIFHSGISTNNLSSVLQYDITGGLKAILSQLQTMDWLMLQVAKIQQNFNSSLTGHTMHSIVQWFQDNNQHISLILKDVELMINSFNNFNNLTDMIQVFSMVIQNQQSLIHQIGGELQSFTNMSFIWNLLDKNLQTDAKIAWLLLQKMESVNMSSIITSVDHLQQIIQNIKGLDLGYTFSNNPISEKIFTIIMEGMKILKNIQINGPITKEDIYQMYDFTYLLVQDEQTWVPFHNISTMEAELLDVLYLAMTQFLRGNGSLANSAQDVLQILIQDIVKNTTINGTEEVTTCKWPSIYNSSDANATGNHTLGDLIYLTLQNSPVFHNVCRNGSLAEERACLIQVLRMSMTILAELNNMSGLRESLIQSLNDSLTFICSSLPDHNATQMMTNLEALLFNQSSPVHLLIEFIVQHYNSTFQTSDLQQAWTQISQIIKILVPVDSHIYDLIETAVNLTIQPNWLGSWQNLENIFAMNWTVSTIDLSLSVLETMRRTVVFVDGVMNGEALQIYQAIASFVNNPVFSALLNMATSQQINTTISSADECRDVVNAVANFSSSVWPMLNQTQSSIEEILSNVGLLACDTLYIQSTNDSWILGLEIINNVLSNVAKHIPAELTGYFMATEKIVSFMSGILQSSNISQEKLWNSIYDLLIQQLKIFDKTTFVADWLEKIPVQNITSILFNSGNVSVFDQVLVLETELLQLLSSSLNASTYSQGISILSDSLMNIGNNISSLSGRSGISQQLNNALTTFAVSVPVPSLTEPYGTVMTCVKNVAADLSDHQTGHLDVAIQDLFNQNDVLANGSIVPELLDQKITQLNNLTTVICGLGTSNSTESYCYIPCQYLTVLQRVADVTTPGIKAAQKTQTTQSKSIPMMLLSLLESLYLALEDEVNKIITSALPVSQLSNITAILSNLTNSMNGTITAPKVTLASIFHNTNQVKKELREKVNLSEPSINALMDVEIPSNKTDIGDWFVTLYRCKTNNSLVAEPLQVFCNLPPDKGYQMAIIFLKNVDILQLVYRMLVPSTWQTNIEYIIAALNNLLKSLDELFAKMPSTDELKNLMQIMNLISGSQTRRKRSVDPLASSSSRATTYSITDIARFMCMGNYKAVFKALYLLYPSITQSSSSTTRTSARSQSINQLYGIPTDNAFCSNLFTTLVQTSSGAGTWMLLKPMLYGQILYTPYTPETMQIMNTTATMLSEVEGYKIMFTTLSNDIQLLMDNMNNINQAMKLINLLQGFLNNTVITGFLQDFLQFNTTDLSAKIAAANSYIQFLVQNGPTIASSQSLVQVLENLLSCVAYNRIKPFNSVTQMMVKANELQDTNELFAAVTFHLSGTSRDGRSASGLPKQIKYTISMRSLLSEDTNYLRDSNWVPGPHTAVNKYSRGFVYLQENIDRAIIQMQTNKTLDNVGVQYQPMPFPCYTKNSFLYSMAFSLPIALMISWVLFIAAFVKKLVHEKELRLHEYMKMMGINSGSHFFAWFIECACFLIITVAILVLILKFGKILPNSDGFILFLFFLDYSLTVIAMGYLISVFFNNTNVAALSGSLIYIITFFPFIVVVSKETDLSFAGKTLLSLFSPTALSYATQYIVSYEERNEGMQWKYMYTSPMLDDSFSFGWLCWIMVIDTMIYFIIGWYIRIVFPGKYGIGAPWYFPFLPSFWAECCGLPNVCSKKPSGLMMSNIVAHGITEKKGGDLYPHNEQEPEDLDVGVSLHGLTKIYQAKAAVENLNLNFYEGHITALLGHNGAGKTTTLSMLTGLFSASSGTIYVYGNDIRTHLDLARKSMGVCMQYDVLFDYLTTKEHLLLYGSIKAPQWKKRQLHEEVKRTLKETGLYRHRHKPVKALSGGMRRKLSICIALIGGSKVVILDEPTTGVDPCSRRGIWEVISKNKKDKTIILSTHHLDEAEVLSDRIAFLERGGLKCCGTPRFLKERFGSGYHLTLTKKFPNKKDESICDSEQVTALIQSHIPEASLKEDVGGELVYVLPPFSAEISGAYLSLLRALDTSLDDLHIGCYGISDTTIEEVFLKLTDGLDEDDELNSRAVPISNVDNLIVDDESSTSSYNFFDRDDQPLDRSENITGFKLLLKKIMAMFIKRFHNSKRNWKGLISQILLPVLFVIAAMGLGSLSLGYAVYPELLLTPEMYGTTDQAIVFGLSNDTSDDLMNAMNSFPGIDNACLDQNSQCLAANSLGSWNSTGDQTIAYGNCNCSTGYAMCQMSIPPHRMTYSKQMMYNLTGRNMEGYLMSSAMQFVQKRYGGWSFGIPTSQIISLVPVPDNLTLSKVWYNNEGRHSLPAFLNSFSNFLLRANLPSTDASKYSISVYNAPLPGAVTQGTTTTTLVNTLVALSILVGYSITTASFVTYVVKEYDNGSKRLQHIAGIGEVCYWMTNFLYDLAIYFIPVALSIAMIAAFKLPAFYNFPNLGAVSLLFILFGYATFSWMYLIAGAFKNPGMAFISYVCINLFIGINTIISSSVVYMLLQQTSTTDKDYQSLNNTYSIITNVFKIFPQFCFGYGLITLSQQQTIKDQLQIYGNSDPVDIFGMDILGYMYVAMVVQGTFCFILRLLINDGIIYSVKTFFKKRILKKSYFTIKDPEEDEDVTAERDRVESGNANGDLLLVQGLTKVFHQVHRNMTAVNNMTLGIPPGECFGLLGVNGAGKTTTFKMLTGDTSPSSGNIQIRNHFGSLVNVLGFNKDWSSFGYCPQEDALDELMTGEEHLYYYARIHGIPERRIKHVVNLLLHKLQLVQYKDRITVNYSCGTRRKLSTALALIGKPSILLLDEPSSGMDPKTKRHLWKIISEEVKEKCAVILTSHSMEECEALCTRLAIMVRGKFQCIGSLQHIKSRFGSGFTVKMHLKDSSVSIETITSFMHSHFPNTFLKEHHFTMAEYHVPVSAGGVASIFDLLESNKKDLNIIHFSVSQTTLDEVFINFAQDQASPDNSRESSQGSLQNVAIA